MPQISIIIATYNSGRTIRVALDSVYNQQFQDWECIIVDGASKDDTLQIVEEFEKMDFRFRHISEPDNGIYDAFNKGWKMASGKWIYYLGSDDTLVNDGLSQLALELDDKYAVVTGDVFLHRIDGSVRKHISKGFFGCHQGVFMQRNTLKEMGGFDEQYKIIADYDLMVRTYKAGYAAKNIRTFVANFFVGGASQKLKSQWGVMKELYLIDKRNKMRPFPLLNAIRSFLLTILIQLCWNMIAFLRRYNMKSITCYFVK